MVAVGPQASAERRQQLADAGCEVLLCRAESHGQRLLELLDHLGRRRLTNVLVEGGGRLLGSLLDIREVDEVHVFIAPRLVGGATATAPTAGEGVAQISEGLLLDSPTIQSVGPDVYVHGRIQRKPPPLGDR